MLTIIPSNEMIIDTAIVRYGVKAQTDVAIEEMAELTQALIRHRRGRPSNITEEIADVEIMLEQLKRIYCINTDDLKQQKLRRLWFRLERERDEQNETTTAVFRPRKK